MWRYSANPIIPRDALSTSNSIFNSAVIPFKKYQNLELRRDAHGDEGGYNYDRYVSFKLDSFKEDLEGKKGIILRVNTRMNGVKYIKIELPREQ